MDAETWENFLHQMSFPARRAVVVRDADIAAEEHDDTTEAIASWNEYRHETGRAYQ